MKNKSGDFAEKVSLHQYWKITQNENLVDRAFLAKFLIYGQLEFILHYKIHSFLTHGTLNVHTVSKFSFYVGVMKAQLFANI